MNRKFGPREFRHREHHRNRNHAVVIRCDDVAVALAGAGDQARFSHVGHGFVIGLEAGDFGYIFNYAIIPVSHHPKLNGLARLGEDDLGRD